MKLYIEHFKMRIVFCCFKGEIKPIKFMQKFAVLFIRTAGRNHEPNLIQQSLVECRLCNNQMPDVDWIEGAEKKADFHRATKVQNDVNS